MNELSSDIDPEWETELTITLSAATIIDTVFATADAVHAGTDSCVDSDLVVVDIVAQDESSENYCRYMEQRYTEDEGEEVTWHDWTIELRLQGMFVVAHWRTQVPGSPADWDWSAAEAEKAFTAAAVLVGRRVRRGIVVDEPIDRPRPSHTRH